MTQENSGKWKIYVENKSLVRVMNEENRVILYGVPIKTNNDVTRFLPYTSARGVYVEESVYEWISDGLPRSVDSQSIKQMEPITKEYVDSLIEAELRNSEHGKDMRKLRDLETKLRFIEFGRTKDLQSEVQEYLAKKSR